LVAFPFAWNYEQKIGPSDAGCPYSTEEMREYLFGCHYHYVTGEEPLQLGDPQYVAELDTRHRHFWLWQVGDQFQRTWYLVIGSGKSPFYKDDRYCHRWLYAEEAEGQDPHEFLSAVSVNHDLNSEPP
jgi:hypothetical protein